MVMDLFWSRLCVRRGVLSSLLLPLVARCLETIDVCIWRMCVSCGSSQCCIMHDLQFVNAGRGCMRHTPELGLPYR